MSKSFKSQHDVMKISPSVVSQLFGWQDPRLLREGAQIGKESHKRMGMRLTSRLFPAIPDLVVTIMAVSQGTRESCFIHFFIISLPNIIYEIWTSRYIVEYFVIDFAKRLLEN